MQIYESIIEIIGKTPLVSAQNYVKKNKLGAHILLKLEYLNPAGSIKDRAALSMIEDAERSGKLHPDSVIIEPTSGNTGIGLAAIASVKGYRTIIVMPDSMSQERRTLMSAYGAELVLTPGKDGMKGAIKKAAELAADMPNSFIPGQFENPANTKAHFETTGPELWADTDGNIDILVAGVGTGGTVTGIGTYLKSKKPDIYIAAVEPENSPVLSGGTPGPHGLQGIGAGFISDILDTSVYDEVIRITDEQAYAAARSLAKTEGILAGISGGAALAAAGELAKRPENAGKNIAVVLPDTGDRYLSTALFAE